MHLTNKRNEKKKQKKNQNKTKEDKTSQQNFKIDKLKYNYL